MPYGKIKTFVFCLISFLALTPAVFAIDQEQQALQDAINKKNQELQQVANQIRENQAKLETAQGQSKSLSKEISGINTNISQVSLGIKQSEVTIDKLGLEVDSLNYNISDAEKQISDKQTSIVSIIQQMQQREEESPLIIFLKNKTLADSIFETQSLTDLNTELSVEITNIKNIKQNLAGQLTSKTDKKRLIELENSNLKNKKIILAETKQDKQSLLTQTKSKEQIYQKSLADLLKQQQDIAAEIEKIDEQLRLKINPGAIPGKQKGLLSMPVEGILSQGYGATKFAKYGYQGKWHNGVDFAAPIGTPVYASEAGRVLASANQDAYCPRGAYGKFVVVQHGNNLTTLYAHLSLQTAHIGDIVNKGDLLGYSGKTGYATGPHLHFGVYDSQTFYIGPSKVCGPSMPFGGDLNPLDYLPAQ
ncbi:MAG: peptidoglycan DD-metalloendopeptidase family protein [Candidatus Wolfebacteria bacterium]|nr:peptidoglycan DD-metalloendopeptidase family protein [Candidatus Wolfebacteria bacterium]